MNETQDSAPTVSTNGGAPPAISPRARRAARQRGIDATTLRASGTSGRIRERDVLAVADTSAGTAGEPAPLSHGPGSGSETRPLTAVRKTIARRMVDGAHHAAPVTLFSRCDATNLVNLRMQLNAVASAENPAPGYNEILIKLAATAIIRMPEIKTQWGEGHLLLPPGVHIAVAVDTPLGLVAPVLRDADRLSLRETSMRLLKLVESARAGRLAQDMLDGGVFAISNLGSLGVDTFTPILNLPQSAILGVGRISREAVAAGDAIVSRDRIGLSLTFDHRVHDGAPAARFLGLLIEAIENPAAWLVD